MLSLLNLDTCWKETIFFDRISTIVKALVLETIIKHKIGHNPIFYSWTILLSSGAENKIKLCEQRGNEKL